jgi:hypothetical protein
MNYLNMDYHIHIHWTIMDYLNISINKYHTKRHGMHTVLASAKERVEICKELNPHLTEDHRPHGSTWSISVGFKKVLLGDLPSGELT